MKPFSLLAAGRNVALLRGEVTTWCRRFSPFVMLVMLAGLAGCNGGSPSAQPVADATDAAVESDANQESATTSEAKPAAGGDSAASAISVTVGGGEEFQQILGKHKGKVVLVDFWATWCGPCVEQFSHTVELSRKFRDRGLSVISVSMDEPTDEEAVLAFLKKEGAEFDNLIGKYGAGTEFAEKFEIRGDVPFYKLYDRTGKLRYQFSTDTDGIELGEPIEKLDERVRELVEEQS